MNSRRKTPARPAVARRSVTLYARRPGGEVHPKWRSSQYGGVEAAKMARRLVGDPL
ncbi:hypothetical protein ACIBCT_23370 [Streptosporangium sp. NPDC050855]|uniref:hypothetical protein n=1 Tax=Streptosporangium sp. NPDC050855 TaxID=3366194 RepID=UPI0037A2E927